jgi:probable aminopeptidase NPEPL1
MPRDRTKSTREEDNVSTYVASVIDFKSNVHVRDIAHVNEISGTDNQTLLIVPEPDTLPIVKPADLWTAEVDAAMKHASVGSVYAFNLADGRRVLLGMVPSSKVSRNNCPVRPDVIARLVTAAVGTKGYTALNVVSCVDGFAEPITTAVAKGSKRSFSAKSGLAEKSYFEACVPITVFLPTNAAAVLNNIAEATQLAMRLVDAPTNLLDTTTYPEIVEGWARKLGVSYSCIRGEDLREQGYGGLYGVGKAAEFPPALVTLTYKPKAGIAPKDKIAFVGKGIVYDTGGLSIKSPGANMCGMKSDMGGSAGVFSAFVALVRAKAPYEIDLVLCLADNAVSAPAQRNDDIVLMKSGKTVEINNTDAEGRLVLGDGVWHAAKAMGKTPSVIVDMATLTGAQGIATGRRHAGLYTNSAEWEQRVVAAGVASGELAFPLLFAPEFHMPEFDSVVADMRNSVRDRSNAQASCAAAFIGDNLPKDYAGAHVHIDMAAPARVGEGATGFGAALLFQLFRQ